MGTEFMRDYIGDFEVKMNESLNDELIEMVKESRMQILNTYRVPGCMLGKVDKHIPKPIIINDQSFFQVPLV